MEIKIRKKYKEYFKSRKVFKRFFIIILLTYFILLSSCTFKTKNNLTNNLCIKNLTSNYRNISNVNNSENYTYKENYNNTNYKKSILNNTNMKNKKQNNISLENLYESNESIINTIKLIPSNKIYIGAFMDFNNSEDIVNKKKIEQFQNTTNIRYGYAYFSNNFYKGIKYPKKEIHEIISMKLIPFVRLMPRSNSEEYQKEDKYTLENIINGKFDKNIEKWALESKKDYEKTKIPLLIDFAVEMNGDWFSWSSQPEKYKQAYRHIIDIFRKNNVSHITWFFHVNIESFGKYKMSDYYPGDKYIDWIGVSIYGALTPEEDWIKFNEILKNNYEEILNISKSKPIALLEFGVVDNHKYGNKAKWLKNAFETIIKRKYINFSSISYWSENWENENSISELRINSSKKALNVYEYYLKKNIFTNNLVFSINNKTNITRKELFKDNSTKIIGWYKPTSKITWQWQLNGKINTNYDVDLYDIDLFETSKDTIEELHKKGIKVICYFSAGSYEDWRPDSKKFPKEILGKELNGWKGERWLDIKNYNKFKDIILNRLDLAKKKGCDGVEPDNIDGYINPTGFEITYKDQLRYNKWLAEETHKRNLAIGLKNDLFQVKDLVNYYDFAINEQCFQYNECDYLLPFIKQNKAVLGVEYELEKSKFCKEANILNFSWLKMNYELKGERDSCK